VSLQGVEVVPFLGATRRLGITPTKESAVGGPVSRRDRSRRGHSYPVGDTAFAAGEVPPGRSRRGGPAGEVPPGRSRRGHGPVGDTAFAAGGGAYGDTAFEEPMGSLRGHSFCERTATGCGGAGRHNVW